MLKRTICIALVALAGCDSNDGEVPQADTAAQQDVLQETSADEDAAEPDASAPDAAGPDAAEDTAIAPPTGQEQTSTAGTHQVWIRDFDGPVGVGATLELPVTIHTVSGGPASGLTPQVAFIHKGMGHGGAKAPYVTEVGGGEYLVHDVQASMAGTWALTLTFAPGDSVTYEVAVQ